MNTKILKYGSLDGNALPKNDASGYDGIKLDGLYLKGLISSREECEETIKTLEIHKYCFPKVEPVPPGIINMTTAAGCIHSWCKECAIDNFCNVHTIEAEGQKWSLGEEVVNNYAMKFKILRFAYDFNKQEWIAFRSDAVGSAMKHVSKVRIPVVVMQGKELFDGDFYWHVKSDWSITKNQITPKAVNSWFQPGNRLFNSKELAEAFVLANEPVYPRSIVEPLLALIPGSERAAAATKNLNEFHATIKK